MIYDINVEILASAYVGIFVCFFNLFQWYAVWYLTYLFKTYIFRKLSLLFVPCRLCYKQTICSEYKLGFSHTDNIVMQPECRLRSKTFYVKSRFFRNRELYWSNLPQNSNCGQELAQKSGVQIPVGEGKTFLSCFLFIFIFSIKNWIKNT